MREEEEGVEEKKKRKKKRRKKKKSLAGSYCDQDQEEKKGEDEEETRQLKHPAFSWKKGKRKERNERRRRRIGDRKKEKKKRKRKRKYRECLDYEKNVRVVLINTHEAKNKAPSLSLFLSFFLFSCLPACLSFIFLSFREISRKKRDKPYLSLLSFCVLNSPSRLERKNVKRREKEVEQGKERK
ncbi:hypothetical protein CSUI_000734 [Cystoisospora suis]|uniref:Uncharacterized protein n=1 Tax=Cystoisospora suis TaxID=483139 RepID=A0A2C6LF28_9APIC|nr:hypothetical protein CSUI_000734 [Cystoisospora suis]